MDTSKEQKVQSPWLLRAVLWPPAVGSFVLYWLHKGTVVVPPTSVLDGTFLWMSVGFFLLPFVRSVKIGKLLELEREVERAKETVREVRDDVRQVTTMVVTGLSATSTARATVVVQQGAWDPTKAPPTPPPMGGAVPPVTAPPVAGAKTASGLPSQPAAAPRSAAELKLLNTLWHFQVERYPNLNSRWTFRVDGPPAEAVCLLGSGCIAASRWADRAIP